MPPKKTKALDATSTEQQSTVSSKTATAIEVKKSKAIEKPGEQEAINAAKKVKVPTHPPTLEMVKDALKALDSKKGSSVQAIRGHILEKYPSVDAVKLRYMLRKALAKGLESGALLRPANSSAKGAQGKFRLAAKKPKEVKVRSENSDPNIEKGVRSDEPKDADSKSKPKPAKKLKPAGTEGPKAPRGADSKVPPAKKPKAKKSTDAAGQLANVEEPPSHKAVEKDGASGSKNAGKRGKKATG